MIRSIRKPSRRTFLQSLGLGATALVPLLEAGRAHAASPKRIILVMTPNGVMQDMYWPTGSMTDWNFPADKGTTLSITRPLTAVKSDLSVIKGIQLQGFDGDAHDNADVLLTGWLNAVGPKQGTPASLDQYLVKALNPPTKFKSLTLGVQVQGGDRISYSGPQQGVTPEEDPYKVFDDLFTGLVVPGGTPAPQADLQRIFLAKKSILDTVGLDLERFKMRLGTDDRLKIDSHIAALRDLERKFDPGFTAGSSTCAPPQVGTKIDVRSVSEFPRVGQLQMDMIVEAMACDLTRIATLQWSNNAANQVVFSWLGQEFTQPADPGVTEFGPLHNHHELSHQQSTYPQLKSRIEQWYHEQFLYLINRLKSKSDGTGTLFDSTVVLWANAMHDGSTHTSGPHLPWLVAGSAGGALKPGRFLDFGTAPMPHNRLLLTLAQAMGGQTDTFGNPAYCSAGPISELTA